MVTASYLDHMSAMYVDCPGTRMPARGSATKGDYMSIQWDKLEPQKYEDMVSVLLSLLYPNARRVDGKDGDGGRDVEIVLDQDNQITDAFELESFTGRMDRTRRRQVVRSLKRAANLEPAQWTLIVPIDPTPIEGQWFCELGTEYCFPIHWFEKTCLDEKMAAFPDIGRYFLDGAEHEVVRLLGEIREEQAMVADVTDALGRLRTLRERLNEIDPHYRYEVSTGTNAAYDMPTDVVFSIGFGDMRVDVYPKYSDATKDRPVTVKVNIIADSDDEVVLDAINYGLDVTVPPRMVGSITVDAPVGDFLWKHSLTAAQTPVVESDGSLGNAACWSIYGRNVYLGAW